MGDTASGLLTIAALLGLLAAAYVPLGDYMATVLTPDRHNRVERVRLSHPRRQPGRHPERP